MKNTISWILLGLLSVAATSANAISINTMFDTADDNGGATYTITNTTQNRIFLNVVMYEFYTENGELKKIPYTRGNIQDWKITVRPARAVINPGFEKDFRVTMTCKSECNNLEDQAFQLGFVPTPYFAEGEQPKHAMQIAVGFGANFVNTGKEESLDFEVTRQGDQVMIYNHSRSLNKVTLSTCDESAASVDKKECEQSVNVIAGRNLPVTLQKAMKGKQVSATIESVDGNYQQSVVILPNQ